MKTNPSPGAERKLRRRMTPAKRSPASPGQIQLLRIRVAAAESLLKESLAQAKQAKRRRKLAKLLAKRARKGAKEAKANLAEAREALARAEAAMMAEPKRRIARRQTRRTKPGARASSTVAKKRPVALRQARPISHDNPSAPLPSRQLGHPGPIEDSAVTPDAGTVQPAGPAPETSTAP